MPESTCLHIQERESGPIRVVEIPWISVRVGRAPHCEVRLSEHGLADEVCRLYRRGQSWHLVPANARSAVVLEGKAVAKTCALPFDVPFRVGRYCLTLRQDRAAEPDWGMYAGPEPRQVDRTVRILEAPYRTTEPPQRPAPPDHAEIDPAIEPAATQPLTTAQGLGPNQEFSRTAGVREGWETRWRVAGAQIKARSERSGRIPDSKKHPYQAGFDSVPLKESRAPRVQPVVPPSIDPALRPIPPTAATRAVPDWTNPVAEPPEPRSSVQRSWTEWNAGEETVDARRRRVPRASSDDRPAREHADCAVVGIPPVPGPGRDEISGSSTHPAAAPAAAAVEVAANPSVIDRAAAADDSRAGATSDVEPAPEISLADDQPAGAISLIEPTPEISLASDQPEGPTRRIEPAPEPAFVENRRDSDPAVSRAEWPSVKDILATHRASSQSLPKLTAGRTAAVRRTRSEALPTLARQPGHWNMPVWLAGPPVALFVLVAGLGGCVLSWWWACDSYSASLMTDRLVTAGRTAQRRPLPDSVAPPTGSWTRSTAQHLAHWAIFLSRSGPERDHRPEEVPALLERALEVSPISPTARLAVAQLEPPQSSTTVSVRSLGLSRDVLSLAWSARRLMAAGKSDAALKMYGQSLAIAVPGESSRGALARFSDDPVVPRYLLPGEERVRDIVRELASTSEWTFADWSAVIPDSAVVRLTAARLLREQGSGAADSLLDLILDQPQTPAPAGTVGPLTLAARAEAFALRSRWKEAQEHYRQAIELIDNDTIKRSWWFNLADVAFHLDDENQRQAALCAAVATSDDITRRATDILRATRRQPNSRSMGVKAN